jgi:3-hydroxymyristoyl/3-hydroxydecanoyl-(acyl carrier protein) dehydratase
MGERFAAFTFVDRITDLEAGRSARGRFDVPTGLARFPGTLVAEAVGQLAAWVAMAHVGFRVRPVAALARDSRYLGDVAPGQRIDLEVEIHHCDDESVVYRGWAGVGGERVRELDDCLGPMLPLGDFDDPQAVREHFDLLCGAGAPPGRFGGVPEPDLSVLEHEPGRLVRASLAVPERAVYFADHFPRRPVFPATLLLDAGAALALELAAGLPPAPEGARFELERVTDVKVRSFISPGQAVELSASLREAGEDAAKVALSARVEGKRAVSAGFEFRAGGRP